MTWQDRFSLSIKNATDVLMVKSPVTTAMGVLFGVILDGVLGTFRSYLTQQFPAISWSSITFIHLIALGIFIFNIGTLLTRNKVDGRVRSVLIYIKEQQKSGNLTLAQAKLYYTSLFNKLVSSVTLQGSIENDKDEDLLKQIVEDKI